jgi:hypothetical protein
MLNKLYVMSGGDFVSGDSLVREKSNDHSLIILHHKRIFHEFQGPEWKNNSPFESAPSMAERMRLTHATVLSHLHGSIDFKSFHLHWVPHLLTEDLRQERKDDARAMLPLLHAAQRDG